MPKNSPNPALVAEQERLAKWREIRRRASEEPRGQDSATTMAVPLSREQRLALFEEDKMRRIQDAESRRRAETESREARRMDKARTHLDALDNIESAKARLLAARLRARRLAVLAFALSVGLPTSVTAIYYGVFAPAIYESRSILALDTALPEFTRNPLYTGGDSMRPSTMAPVFRLRAALYAKTPGPRPFEMSINANEALVTLTTKGSTAQIAQELNAQIITNAHLPLTIVAPTSAGERVSLTPRKTMLLFMTSLSIFSLGAVFLKSILHHART